MDWYDFLREFQTGIVGILGFAGVAWTLRHNAKLAADEREAIKRERESSVLRATTAEIRFLKKSIGQVGNIVEPRPGEYLDIPRIERSITTDFMVEIAALQHPEVDEIIDSLMTVDEVDRFMVMEIGAPKGGYFSVGPEKFPYVQKIYSSVFDRLENVLERLK